MRLKGIISYKGTNFYGYQIQKVESQRSVQKDIQDVLKKIFSKDIKIYSSGRTDRGVHALGQVIHFDIENEEVEVNRLKHSLNCLLSDDIHVISLEKVSDDFHARFSASKKEYHYKMNIGEYSPITSDIIYSYYGKLNIELMKKAMELFVGKHNFINFCANDDNDYEREIYSFELDEKDDLLTFKIQGNGFRRYMVRMIIGSLIEVGKEKLSLEKIQYLLTSGIYERVSFKAPSNGLYLYKVYYDGNEGGANDGDD